MRKLNNWFVGEVAEWLAASLDNKILEAAHSILRLFADGVRCRDNLMHFVGEVAEWLNAAVLKTVIPFCGIVSSNLTLSVFLRSKKAEKSHRRNNVSTDQQV